MDTNTVDEIAAGTFRLSITVAILSVSMREACKRGMVVVREPATAPSMK